MAALLESTTQYPLPYVDNQTPATSFHLINLGITDTTLSDRDHSMPYVARIKEVSYFFDTTIPDKNSPAESANFFPHVVTNTGDRVYSCYLTTDDAQQYNPMEERSFANMDCISIAQGAQNSTVYKPHVIRFDDDINFGIDVPMRNLRLVQYNDIKSLVLPRMFLVIKIKYQLFPVDKNTFLAMQAEMK